MHRPLTALAITAAAVVLLTACNDDSPTPRADDTPSTSSSPSASDSPTQSPSETPSESPSQSPSETTSEPPTGSLDWKAVPGSVDDTATVSGKWTLTLSKDGTTATIAGPKPATLHPQDGFRYTDALIDGQYAVVAAEDKLAERPSVATVVTLRTGKTSTIDGSSAVPTTTGGPWVLSGGMVVHAATDGRDYCLAVVDLLATRQSLGPCVPPHHGITNVSLTPAGFSAMTFDSGHPSCRTVNRIEGTSFQPLDGPTACKAWDVVTTETGQVWSEIPNEKRVEDAELYADFGNGVQDLGPGTSGTLTWCGSSAYFVRDPQTASDPAQLMQVTPDGAQAVYSSPGKGQAFLSDPRCGGDDLTITALTSDGDEQVSARVG